MPFRPGLAILICLILIFSGCLKAPPPPRILVPPPESPPKVKPVELYDPDLPARYRDLLRRTPGPAQENVPLAFLAAADDFAGQGETPKALRFIDRAASGFARGKNPLGEATALSRRALLLMNLGREREAREQIREASEKWKAPPLNAFGAYLDGHFALLKGDYPAALEALKAALRDNGHFRENPYLLKLRRDTELDAGVVSVLADCGSGGITAPDFPAGPSSAPCLGVCQPKGEGLFSFAGGGTPQTVAGVSGAAGSADAAAPAGRDELNRALELNAELAASPIAALLGATDFQRTEAEAHNFLGLSATKGGDRAEAFRHLARAGEMARASGFVAGEIRGLLFGAELGLQEDSDGAGRRAAEGLLRRADSRGASPYRIRARVLLARYTENEGRRREAIALLQEAVEIVEAQRCPAGVEMLGALFLCRGREIHEQLVTLLAAQGMAAEALKAAEAGKKLAMVGMLCGQELGRTDAEREFLRQEARLAGEIRGLQRDLLHLSDEAAAREAMARLEEAQEGYRTHMARIATDAGRLHSLMAFHGVDPASLQGGLDGNTSLFDYFATGEALYVWAVQRERIHLERIALPRAAMRELVFSFLAALKEKDRRKTEQIARRAYDLLLQPIIPFVSGERIGFVPDDALTYLPFSALRYRGRYLVEGFSLFQLPEAAMLRDREGGALPAGMRILAFGNPDLENETLDLARAPQEVERIRRRVGGTRVLLRQEATEEKAEELAEGYDILHFAVRGQFFPDKILESGLLLTPDAGDDGRLTVREIFGLRFGGRAVVLSGCDPMPQSDPEGRGLDFLQRAFLSTGSPSVISTLWLSDDKGVARLLDLFYRQLAKKASLVDALRTAQLQLLREGHGPGLWAAFVFTGKY